MKRLFSLTRTRFVSDALTLSIGTAVAQAIPIASLPILARLFTPEDFGIFGLYAAIVAVLAVVASGRYELAIMLPEAEDDADALVLACAVIAVMFGFLLFCIVLVASERIAELIGQPKISAFLFLVPAGVVLTAIYTALSYWLNRARKFRRMSANRIGQATLANGSSIVFGFAKLGVGGLVFGQLLGMLATTAGLAFSFLRTKPAGQIKCLLQRSLGLLHVYRNHPAHLLPSHIVGTIAMQVPIFALTLMYGAAVGGYYLIAYRLVSLPTTAVAGAIGDVYRQRASVAYRQRGEFRDLFIVTLRACAASGIVPALVIFLTAPTLFALLLGEEWRVAGEYARFLVFAAYFQFISTPIDKGALIVRATRYIFVWHLLRLISFILAFVAGYYFSLPVERVLILFSAANIAIYSLDIVVEYRLSRQPFNRRTP